jgi:hypothetical protein
MYHHPVPEHLTYRFLEGRQVIHSSLLPGRITAPHSRHGGEDSVRRHDVDGAMGSHDGRGTGELDAARFWGRRRASWLDLDSFGRWRWRA